MDQKRLLLAVALSIAVLLGFQFLFPSPPASRQAQQAVSTKTTPSAATPGPVGGPAYPGTQPMPVPPPREVPRLAIDAPRVKGSVSLVGARLDDLVLIGRDGTRDRPFPALLDDLRRALERAGVR